MQSTFQLSLARLRMVRCNATWGAVGTDVPMYYFLHLTVLSDLFGMVKNVTLTKDVGDLQLGDRKAAY